MRSRRSILFLAGALLVGTAAAAAAALPRARTSFPGSNGVVTFAASWPLDLSWGTDPNTETVELCGVGIDGRSVRLTASPTGRAWAEPAWNSTGTVLAAERTAPVAGGGVGFVSVGSAGASRAQFDNANHPTWAPDGSRIAYDAPSPAGSSRWLFVANVDGTSSTPLLKEAASVVDFEPAWSPDGSWIAFSSNRDGAPYQLSVVHPDGRGLKRVTSGADAAYRPKWSPSGTSLVYISQGASGPGRLATVGLDGASPHLLGVVAAEGVFSPDGNRLAWISSGGAVHVANADGSAARVVYRGAAAGGGIDWQPLAAVGSRPLPKRPCVLYGTAGRDTLTGSGFADAIVGASGADRVNAGASNDIVFAGPGNDSVDGGAGDDAIDGGSGSDKLVGGPGRDVLAGGPGADVIYARDGTRDAIACGPGRDIVFADKLDSVAKDCERILRAGS